MRRRIAGQALGPLLVGHRRAFQGWFSFEPERWLPAGREALNLRVWPVLA